MMDVQRQDLLKHAVRTTTVDQPNENSPLINTVNSKKEPSESDYVGNQIGTSTWRWVVLIVFSLNLAMTNIIWIPSAPIADTVTCYYDISLFWVNALSEVYMVIYIVLLFPGVWLLDRYGLRLTVMLGAACDAAGAALKLAGSGSNYFWVTMFGQTLGSFGNMFIWTAASFLSEVWFPSRERATATAIGGAIAPQVGILLGLGVTPFVVHTDPDLQLAVCGNATSPPFASPEETKEWSDLIYSRLLYFNSGVAALGMIIFALTIFFFPNAPRLAPSESRLKELEHREKMFGWQQSKQFVLSILRAFKNVYFLMYMTVASIIIAIAGAIVSVINEIVHPYFPDHDEEIGYLGITSEATSVIAMLVAGRVLDWTKAFYAMNLVFCILALICMILYTVLILFQSNFYLLYIPSVFLGLSLAPFQAVAYEYAIEMSYPLPEGISAGLINCGSQVVSIVVISFVGHFAVSNVPVGLWFMVGVTALGTLIALFVRPKLRRVEIDKNR